MNIARIEELTKELEKELATDIPELDNVRAFTDRDIIPANIARKIAERLFDVTKAEGYGACRNCRS